jgi:uracil-DNA glycosylase
LPAPIFNQLHSDWQEVLQPLEGHIADIEKRIKSEEITPDIDLLFRSLSKPLKDAKVVIFGQDPYPTKGHAHGLAFSVDKSVSPIPATLRNIFIELLDDVGQRPTHGDLSEWFNQGVLLVNRILSTTVGASLEHSKDGWQEVTHAVAAELGKRNVVAILWGKSAGELATHFRNDWIVQSVHPSPLSAYRGFFGSKPFSSTNQILSENGISPINW